MHNYFKLTYYYIKLTVKYINITVIALSNKNEIEGKHTHPAMKKLLTSLTQMGDIRLVKHVQHGNNRAFAALVAKHSPDLYSIARKILHNSDSAKDAVQEVWITALPKFRKHIYKEKGRLPEWLHTLAHRIAMRMKKHEDRYIHDEKAAENNLENEAIRSAEKEPQPSLLSLLKILNRKLRLIVILHAIKGMKFKEIAVKMRIDEDVARALYGRAIGYLRNAVVKMKKKNNFD